MRLTTMRYYTPSGRSIQAEGIHPDVVIQSNVPIVPGSLVRERDLEGHLPAEGNVGPKSAQVIVDKSSGPTGPVSAAEMPVDPAKGTDFALSIGYRLLVEATGATRTAL